MAPACVSRGLVRFPGEQRVSGSLCVRLWSEGVSLIIITVSPKKNHDPARGNEISGKLMENPELASLISELATSSDDASDLL